MLHAFIALQLLVVIFVALHDWIPLGRFNDIEGIRAADSKARLAAVTVASSLPFAFGFAASLRYTAAGFPAWLLWELWIAYGTAVYGMLRTWWLPYLVFEDRARVARYRVRFARTHAFLPVRNGIRSDSLHVGFHVVLVATLILLAILTLSGGARSGLAGP